MTESAAAMPTPTAADQAARTEARATRQERRQEVTADPDAPYGYMKDPKTGETRPRKRPGRQKVNRESTEAPRDRPSNRTRKGKSPVERKPQEAYIKPLSDLTEATWMILAAAPEFKGKVLGRDLSNLTVRLRAQAAILKDESASLVNGVSMMAAHNDVVAKGVDKLAAESGPAWILPAMFALIPFVASSANVWKSEPDQIRVLAKRTKDEWDEFIANVTRQAELAQLEPGGQVIAGQVESDANAAA